MADQSLTALCTGLTAVWCPVCGDCTCIKLPTGAPCFCSDDCPLHSVHSRHADTDMKDLPALCDELTAIADSNSDLTHDERETCRRAARELAAIKGAHAETLAAKDREIEGLRMAAATLVESCRFWAKTDDGAPCDVLDATDALDEAPGRKG